MTLYWEDLKKEVNALKEFKQGNKKSSNAKLSRKVWKISIGKSKQTYKNSHTAMDKINFTQNWFPKSVVCKISAVLRIQMPLFYEGLERSCSESFRRLLVEHL